MRFPLRSSNTNEAMSDFVAEGEAQVDPQDRKLQQRIARRELKVQRLIREQETRLAALDSATFLRQQDYLQAMSIVRKKLYYLEQELSALEAGRLPGIRV